MLIEKVIELVPENELKLPVHYLPHRPVVKEIGTTRIQIVFDETENFGETERLTYSQRLF